MRQHHAASDGRRSKTNSTSPCPPSSCRNDRRIALGGALDPEEHLRLTHALHICNRAVADVAVPLAEIHAVPVTATGSGPTVAAIERALAETGYSRFPITDPSGRFIGYLHINDVLPLIDDRDAAVDLTAVRPLSRVRDTLPLPDALTRLRRSKQPPGAGHQRPW